MAVRQAEVRCIVQHYDKNTRSTVTRGSTFVLPLDSAKRRQRAGLVEIVREFSEESGPKETKIPGSRSKAKKETPPEDTIPEEPVLDPVEAPIGDNEPIIVDVELEGMPDLEVTLELEPDKKPTDLITRRGESSWFDVEGYDSNPVQGRGKALEIAKGLLDT